MNMTKQDILNYFKNDKKAEVAMYNEWRQPEDWDNVQSESVVQEDCGSTYYTVYKFTVDDSETFYLRFDCCSLWL